MAHVTHALPRPDVAGLASHWSVQPLTLIAAVALVAWYLHGVRQVGAWPGRRTAAFLVGVALFAWATNGYPQAYAHSLFWMWTAQTLALLLVIPIVIMAGQPVELGRQLGGRDGLVDRVLRSRPGRPLQSPLLGPALVIVLSAVLFFGPLPGWAISQPAVGWILHLALLALGAALALPLVDRGAGDVASLAVGVALIIGIFELILDAIPGIALRLQTHLVTSFFAHRVVHPWSPRPLHDQQFAGGTLWCVAELIDLPFLILVFLRWVQVDRAEAGRVDAVLEAERHARQALPEPERPADTDAPWWLSDPALRDRFRD
jgi:cytochrome c oxidase assembly factor CtaG